MNLGRLVMGTPGPLPVHAGGHRRAARRLRRAGRGSPRGHHRPGLTIGRPLALLLALKRPGCNAAVTVVHTGVPRPGRLRPHGPTSWWPRPASAGLVTPDMVKPGAAVVGAGTTWEGRKLLSDVDESVAEVAGWITPRLGGVGPHDPGHAPAQRRAGGRAPR